MKVKELAFALGNMLDQEGEVVICDSNNQFDTMLPIVLVEPGARDTEIGCLIAVEGLDGASD